MEWLWLNLHKQKYIKLAHKNFTTEEDWNKAGKYFIKSITIDIYHYKVPTAI